MREKSGGDEYVLSVPADTSLYFLSGTHSSTRVFAFTPGMIAPGRMTELLRDIATKNVRYLIWSNRIFWEYGVPRFGTDFGQTFGTYLTTHYHRVRPLLPGPVKLENGTHTSGSATRSLLPGNRHRAWGKRSRYRKSEIK